MKQSQKYYRTNDESFKVKINSKNSERVSVWQVGESHCVHESQCQEQSV